MAIDLTPEEEAMIVANRKKKPRAQTEDIGKITSDVLTTQADLKRAKNLPSKLDPMSPEGRAAYWDSTFGTAKEPGDFNRSAEDRAAIAEKRFAKPPNATLVALNDLQRPDLTPEERVAALNTVGAGVGAVAARPPIGSLLSRPRPWQSGPGAGASVAQSAGGVTDLVGSVRNPQTGQMESNQILGTSRPAAPGDTKSVPAGTYGFTPQGNAFKPPGGAVQAGLPDLTATPIVPVKKTLPDELPFKPDGKMLAEFKGQHGSEFDPNSSVDRAKMAVLKPRQMKKGVFATTR